jgi:hypothetical protein
MTLFCHIAVAAWAALCLTATVSAQPPSSWKGRWLEPDDQAFAFASSDPTIPGTRFHWTEATTQLHSGQVFDSDGQPAANADVWFSGIFGRVPIREHTLSRSDGTFELAIPSMKFLGPIQWTISATKGNQSSKPFRNHAFDGIALNMERGRTVAIRALTSNTVTSNLAPPATTPPKPIQHFTVHTEDGRVLRSDELGTCLVQGLPPRIQYLGVSSPNHAYRYAMVDLFEDRDYAFNFSLAQGGSVRGTVRDPKGLPVAWNTVESQTCESVIINLGRTFTNDQGDYILDGVRMDKKSSLSAFSHRDGQVIYSEEAPVDFQDARVATADFQVTPERVQPPEPFGMMLGLNATQPPPPAVFRGQALLSDGSPCKEFTLRVQPSQSGLKHGGFPASYSSIGIRFASHDGRFVFSGLSLGGNYRLVLSAPGCRDAHLDPVQPFADDVWQDSEPILFELESSATIRLAIVDTNENPVPNATAKLFRASPDEHLHSYYKDRFLFQGTTDAQGILTLPDITLAMGRWVIESPSLGEQQFPWNGEQEPRITLQQPISLRLRFQFDPDLSRPLDLMLLSKQGEILHRKQDLSQSNAEWTIPNLLPDTYTLAIDSPNGAPELCFDAQGKSRFQQQLNATNPEAERLDYSFDIVATRPNP